MKTWLVKNYFLYIVNLCKYVTVLLKYKLKHIIGQNCSRIEEY